MNSPQTSSEQIVIDFSKTDNDEESLKRNIESTIINLLKSHNQPSANELLKILENEFGWTTRLYFKDIIKNLRLNNKIQSYLKQYLNVTISVDEIDAALRNNLLPSKEFKSTLDDLFKRSFNYRNSKLFFEALQFAAKFRDYAPYNNLLIKIQNPSCSFYATEMDWERRFNRQLKEDAKPMLILAPMHPVMLVYDIDETVGEPLPERYLNFSWAEGNWNSEYLELLIENSIRKRIQIQQKELGSLNSGFATTRLNDRNFKMRIAIHKSMPDISKYSVLVHELAHIFLGHLGTDDDQWWPCRINLTHSNVEIEAESVSYIVCNRLGIETSAPAYLASHIKTNIIPPSVSIDLIFKVAGKIDEMSKKLLPPRQIKK